MTRNRPLKKRRRRLEARPKRHTTRCTLQPGFGPIRGHDLSPAGNREIDRLRDRQKRRRFSIGSLLGSLLNGRKKRQATTVEPEDRHAA